MRHQRPNSQTLREGSRRSSGRVDVRVVLGIVAVVAIGAGLWVWLKPTPVAPGILFIGDSVTYMSTEELDGQLEAESPIVVARVGATASDMLPLFEQAADKRVKEDDPLDQVAILIGYNDVLKDQVDDPTLGAFMDEANRFQCAVWLTLPDVPLRVDQVEVWNKRVTEAAKDRPNVHVVDDWREAVGSAEPGEITTRKDGVHPTPAGAKRLVEIYTDAVHRVC